MGSKVSFEVKNPPVLYHVCKWAALVLLGVIALYAVTTPQPHPAIIGPIALLFVFPLTVVAVYTKRYRIKVKDTTITLQRGFRAKPVSFDVSDVTKLVCIVTDTRAGQNFKITAHTTSCGTFTVETLMTNSGKMKEFLEQYAAGKFQVIHKNFGL